MNITSIEIKNFRGISYYNIEDLGNYTQIIGKNDTGKSTIMTAILKVLDKRHRTFDFEIDDFNDLTNPIQININVNCGKTQDMEPEKFTSSFPVTDSNGNIKLSVTSEINEDNEIESTFMVNDNPELSLPDLFEVVYISPQYSLDSSFSKVVKEIKKINSLNKINDNLDVVKEKTSELNDSIANVESVSQIQGLFDNGEVYKSMFGDSNIKIKSQINMNNIHSSLELFEEGQTDISVELSGDGKRRMISNELDVKAATIKEKSKAIIVLVEEPENHLFPDKQRKYLEELSNKEQLDQIIITTHSPHIVRYNKDYSIVKLHQDSTKTIQCKENNFGYYYSLKMAEMFYCDNILCVEGYSEEIFYDYMSRVNKSFENILSENRFGIFNIKGVGFEKYVNSFKSLGINVFIKTDNDITKVPNRQEYTLSGINRALKYVANKQAFVNRLEGDIKDYFMLNLTNDCKTLKSKLVLNEKKIPEDMQSQMDTLCKSLAKEGIFISNHIDGFERDLQNFWGKHVITDEKYMDLKNKKAENLYQILNNLAIEDNNNICEYDGFTDIEIEDEIDNNLFSFVTKMEG